MKFAQWAKMYVALAGLIAQGLIAEATFLPAAWLYGFKVVAIVATAFAVWKVQNAPEAPSGLSQGYTHEGPGTLH